MQGLEAIAAEARNRHGKAFEELSAEDQDELLRDVQHNRVESRYWGDLPAGGFFMHHLLKEVVGIYYSHPAAWSEIGFGGPASPARLCAARPRRARSVGSRRARFRERRCLTSPSRAPSTAARPTCSARGKWIPMRSYTDSDEVDFAIVGTGAGGGTLACKLAEAGFSVVAFDAGPFWRPLEDFVSDESWQGGLYWTDERITGGADPVELGSNNSGRGVGGSTVHYTMIALRWRPEWFKCKSTLGYGRDWPISFDELEPYYEEAEEALKISGPIQLSVGQAAQALSLSRASGERARAGAGARLRSASASNGRRSRSRRFRRRAAWRIPASIAASAPTAARPTPSRACSSPSFRARLQGRRRDPRPRDGRQGRDGQGRPRDRAHLSPQAASGGTRRRGTSSSPAMRSRPRGCC